MFGQRGYPGPAGPAGPAGPPWRNQGTQAVYNQFSLEGTSKPLVPRPARPAIKIPSKDNPIVSQPLSLLEKEDSQGFYNTFDGSESSAPLYEMPPPNRISSHNTQSLMETPFHEYSSSTADLVLHLIEDLDIDVSNRLCKLLTSKLSAIQCSKLDKNVSNAILQKIITSIMSLYYLHNRTGSLYKKTENSNKSADIETENSNKSADKKKSRILNPYCASFKNNEPLRNKYIKEILSDLIYQIIIFIGPGIIYEIVRSKITEYSKSKSFKFLENENSYIVNILSEAVKKAAAFTAFISNNPISRRLFCDALWSYMYPKMNNSNNYAFKNLPLAFYNLMYPRTKREGLYYGSDSKTIDNECIDAILKCVASLINGNIQTIKKSIENLVDLFDINAVVDMIMLAVTLNTRKYAQFSLDLKKKCNELLVNVLEDRNLIDRDILSVSDAIIVSFDVAVRRRVIDGFRETCFEMWKLDEECKTENDNIGLSSYPKIDSDSILATQLKNENLKESIETQGGRAKSSTTLSQLKLLWATLSPKLKEGKATDKSVARFGNKVRDYLRNTAHAVTEHETIFFFSEESVEAIANLQGLFKKRENPLLNLLKIELFPKEFVLVSDSSAVSDPDTEFAWALYHYTKKTPNRKRTIAQKSKHIWCYHTASGAQHATYWEPARQSKRARLHLLEVAAVENLALAYSDYINKDMYIARCRRALTIIKKTAEKLHDGVVVMIDALLTGPRNAPHPQPQPKRADIKQTLDKIVPLFIA